MSGETWSPKELLVVAGVDDYRQVARIDPADQAAHELSGPHSPRKRSDRGLEGSE